MAASLLICNVVLAGVLIAFVFAAFSRFKSDVAKMFVPVSNRIDATRNELDSKFGTATADMARRLEETRGNLRQDITDRNDRHFKLMREAVEAEFKTGRSEQSMTLDRTVSRLEGKFRELQGTTAIAFKDLADRQEKALTESRSEQFTNLEKTVSRLEQKFGEFQKGIELRLEGFADRQTRSLAEARAELTNSLTKSSAEQSKTLEQTVSRLEQKFNDFQKGIELRLGGFADSQTRSLATARTELTESLTKSSVEQSKTLDATISRLERQFTAFQNVTVQ